MLKNSFSNSIGHPLYRRQYEKSSIGEKGCRWESRRVEIGISGIVIELHFPLMTCRACLEMSPQIPQILNFLCCSAWLLCYFSSSPPLGRDRRAEQAHLFIVSWDEGQKVSFLNNVYPSLSRISLGHGLCKGPCLYLSQFLWSKQLSCCKTCWCALITTAWQHCIVPLLLSKRLLGKHKELQVFHFMCIYISHQKARCA